MKRGDTLALQNKTTDNNFKAYHQTLTHNISSPIILEYKKTQLPTNKQLNIPLWHEALEIKYFLNGGAEINCGSNCFLTETGDLVIINPFEYHSTRIFSEEILPVYHMMNIDLNHPSVRSVFSDNPELFENKDETNIPFFINRIGNQNLDCVKLFLLLTEECQKNGNEFTPYLESLLKAFLYSIIKDGINPDHPDNLKSLNSATSDLVPALQYIDIHFCENISISTLADLCRLSVSRFSHLFKEVTGTSAIQYLNDLRISKAAMYLNTTNLSVSDIALKIGFSDAAYFSRIYKKSLGISPSDYRKKKSE